jgi:hypothetical protein
VPPIAGSVARTWSHTVTNSSFYWPRAVRPRGRFRITYLRQ